MFEKVQRNLIWWNAVVVLSVMIVVVLAMYFSVSNSIEQEVNRDLTDTTNRILQATKFVPLAATTSSQIVPTPPPPPTSKAVMSSKEKDKEEKDHEEQEHAALTGRLETQRDLRVDLSNTFYFLLDSKGVILQNSRQITSTGLPDLTTLNQVVSGETLRRELKLENGSEVELYSVPVKLENGQVVGMLQVGKDLTTHQKQLQDVILTTGVVSLGGLILTMVAAFLLTKHSLVPIKMAMERQREFIADASHELRTPLTLIRANAEVALRSKSQTIAQNEDLLDDICQEADHLGLLVTDLLTLAQADMGKVESKPEPLELNKMAQEAVRQLAPLAKAKQLSLRFETHSTTSRSDSAHSQPTSGSEIWLMADRLRIRQLLLILLDNAIKYTNTGEVTLLVGEKHGAAPGRSAEALIQVSDTGIGIPQDKLKEVFERFFRVDKARTRSEGGFGLGLSIAKWIVEIHNGNIKVTSEVGQGTTFTVALPNLIDQKSL